MNKTTTPYEIIIIIGAGRSGTNILRDTLTAIPGWKTWDCDEINLVWLHGNTSKQEDRLTQYDARPEVKKFIRGYFDNLAKRTDAKVIVEKTCANSLRIPFIKEIFPEARFVFIARDGRDVVISASKRWVAPIEPKYLWKKILHVPKMDIPLHGIGLLKNRLIQRISSEKRLSNWGPRFANMKEFSKSHGLAEICAQQWTECVQIARADLATMPTHDYFSLRYEDLVRDPIDCMKGFEKWYGKNVAAKISQDAYSKIKPGTEKVRLQLADNVLEMLRPTLEQLNYRDTN